MLRTPLCDMLDIDCPILQGALGPHDTSTLAAAVSKAGGLGMISSIHGPEVDRKTRDQLAFMHATGRSFGMNIPVKSAEGAARLQAALDLLSERQDLRRTFKVVVTSAGSPSIFNKAIRDAGLYHFHVVASVEHAKKAVASGCTGLIVEGNESGGHVASADGPTSMTLIPAVTDAVGVPVVAAGGFVDGKGLVAAMALGAVGMQMGTRFYMTREASFAPTGIQAALLKAGMADTAIVPSVFGPNRHWKNAYVAELIGSIAGGKPASDLDRFKSEALAAYADDVADRATVPIGMSIGRINAIAGAGELVTEIMAEAAAVIDRLHCAMAGRSSVEA